jgi:hypothetical protein
VGGAHRLFLGVGKTFSKYPTDPPAGQGFPFTSGKVPNWPKLLGEHLKRLCRRTVLQMWGIIL